jgi:hypothetical protein
MSATRLSRREQRARAKACPELNREHRDILVGRPYGEPLMAYLKSNGVKGLVKEESFADMIILGSDTILDDVERLLQLWTEGADFRPPRTDPGET